MTRIGPRMKEAAEYVMRNPGCAIRPVSIYLGFTRNWGLGYNIVHRAINAGLIITKPGTRKNRYALYPAS